MKPEYVICLSVWLPTLDLVFFYKSLGRKDLKTGWISPPLLLFFLALCFHYQFQRSQAKEHSPIRLATGNTPGVYVIVVMVA